jgi:hypothetical protein
MFLINMAKAPRKQCQLPSCSIFLCIQFTVVLFISWGCVPGNRDLNRKDVNRKLLDTVIYLTFVTKFSFSFQI